MLVPTVVSIVVRQAEHLMELVGVLLKTLHGEGSMLGVLGLVFDHVVASQRAVPPESFCARATPAVRKPSERARVWADRMWVDRW